MNVLEDQMTRNTGRKQSPCLNQNILARVLLRGASRETRTHEKKLSCFKSCSGIRGRVCWGLLPTVTWWCEPSLTTYCIQLPLPQNAPCGPGYATETFQRPIVPLKLTVCLFCWKTQLLLSSSKIGWMSRREGVLSCVLLLHEWKYHRKL